MSVHERFNHLSLGLSDRGVSGRVASREKRVLTCYQRSESLVNREAFPDGCVDEVKEVRVFVDSEAGGRCEFRQVVRLTVERTDLRILRYP